MKKFISVILALLMLFALMAPAASAVTEERILAGVCDDNVQDLHVRNGIAYILTQHGRI